MSMIGAIITPHPPVLLPEVGGGREAALAATDQAMREAAEQVAAWQPEVLVIASPHTILYSDYFHIAPGEEAVGDMGRFGAPQVRIPVRYDSALRTEIVRRAEAAGLSAGTLGQRDAALDHGLLIPLYYLRQAGVHCPIVRVGLSGFGPLDHYRLGACIRDTIEALNRRAVFVASGDLSHKLKADGPYGFAPEGPQFDTAVTEAMATGDFLAFLTMDTALSEKAAECGLRAFQMMAGALDGCAVTPRLLSHEGPFGVGYAVATFAASGKDSRRCYTEAYIEALQARRAGADAWVQLARLSLETYVRTGKRLRDLPADLPVALRSQTAGAFVSLHIGERLRGCIGTIAPTKESLAWEIVDNAIAAASRDPRFSPVRPEELEQIDISVDVLGEPEPVTRRDALDPKRYGVIVSHGGRRCLLLPDLDGVDSVSQQLDIACQKAGIAPSAPFHIERFEVVRHQ